jgi:hypothetical protein
MDIDIADAIREGNARFETACAARHVEGAKEYGPIKFLEAPTIEMALEEIADLANYARYTYIKLHILQLQMEDVIANQPGFQPAGTPDFIPTGGGV